MVVKYAYVLFVGDRRLPYIVNVNDIADLRPPRAVNDFKKDYEYSVKWDGSDRAIGKFSDFYPAIIKCLGATIDEILEKVKSMRLKTPSMSLVLLPSAADDDCDDLDENVAREENSSCLTDTPVAQKSAFQDVQRKRMKTVLQGKERKEERCHQEMKDSSKDSQKAGKQKSHVKIVPFNSMERISSIQSTSTQQLQDRVQKESKKADDVNHNEMTCKKLKMSQEVSKAAIKGLSKPKTSLDKLKATESGLQCNPGFAGTSEQLTVGLISPNTVESKETSSWESGSAGTEVANQFQEILFADVFQVAPDSEISQNCKILYQEKAVEEAPSKSEATTLMSCEFEDDYESDDAVIEDQIAKAIIGEKPLKTCYDDQVYLGSGITINKEAWEKRMINMKKDSLFCNDLPQLIWGRKMMSSRTLEGTKSKSKATPKKRKVCEAVYRGRLKARGVTDSMVVDLLVEKTCKPA